MKSKIFANYENVQEILKNPVGYIESQNFFSWERFFLQLLVEESKSKDKLKYPMSKKSLPSGYLTEENINDMSVKRSKIKE